MPLQQWIHHWEEGPGAQLLKTFAAILAFIALACVYDLFTYQGFSSEEAMENAQLARNISEGKGYTTDSIRPLALYMLASAAPTGQSSKALAGPVPDLSNAPVYPFLLGLVMKILPFKFGSAGVWSYQPERWISLFNQVIFFATVVLLFSVARHLFDTTVAWLAAMLFAGTRLFWQFSISGLSTNLLILLFLGVIGCLAAMERRDREATEGTGGKSVPLALLAGILLGLCGLTRYSFVWMAIPVLGFVALNVARGRGKLCLAMAAAFLVVVTPWIARNLSLSGHCFGTNAYVLAQGTPTFPYDTMERSNDPSGGLKEVAPLDVVNKFLVNAREICIHQLPELGGNWISAFFLAGLLIPFRNEGLQRIRGFTVFSLLLLLVLQAVGQTHATREAMTVNSENLLAVLSPLIFIYGAAMFSMLLDQLQLSPLDARGLATAAFVTVLSLPLIFALLVPRELPINWPYAPLHIQQTAAFVPADERLMSDIPSGVAWYGQRECVWLPLDDDQEFYKLNALKPVHALFLTQVTTDEPFLSGMALAPKSWGRFVIDCAEHGEVPAGFPLRKAPYGLLPEQLFLSDKAHWREAGPGR